MSHRFATRAVHAGAAPDPATGARTVPIYQTNGFVFDDLDHGADIFALRKAGFAYSRASNPTNAALERRVADLEGGTMGVAIGSGQAAWLLVLLTLLESDDEYVGSRALFGGSIGLMKRLESRYRIRCHWADATPEGIAAALTPKTKAVVIESIVNPTGEVVDVPGIAAVARRANVPLVVDNTLASPALLRPFEHGADIIIHSASKYIGGSGNAIGGVVVDGGRFDWRGDERYPLMSQPWEDYDGIVLTDAFPQAAFGAACRLMGLREFGPGMAPTTAFLLLTGCETLHLRMGKHCENADAVARFLSGHAAFEHVSYPLLATSPNNNLARALCPDGAGAIFMATLTGGEAEARRILNRFKVWSHLVNLGETRSLVSHPASTTHRTLTEAERASFRISGGTLRLSVGIEHVDDLISDFEQALAA